MGLVTAIARDWLSRTLRDGHGYNEKSIYVQTHPGVEIISRDRGDEYIKGASQGAPRANQVANRFHLLVNMREALMRAVDRHHGHVLEAAKAVAASQEPDPSQAAPAERQLPPDHRAARSQQRRADRLERYQHVVELNERGMSLRGIARCKGMHRATVRHWLGAGSFPERAGRHVTSRTNRFLDYLRRRWDEGCHNAAQLTREIRAMGFGGTAVMVRRRVARWRRGERAQCCRPASRLHAPPHVRADRRWGVASGLTVTPGSSDVPSWSGASTASGFGAGSDAAEGSGSWARHASATIVGLRQSIDTSPWT